VPLWVIFYEKEAWSRYERCGSWEEWGRLCFYALVEVSEWVPTKWEEWGRLCFYALVEVSEWVPTKTCSGQAADVDVRRHYENDNIFYYIISSF